MREIGKAWSRKQMLNHHAGKGVLLSLAAKRSISINKGHIFPPKSSSPPPI